MSANTGIEWCHHTKTPFADSIIAYRVGKATAGRLLDGRTWDEVPG